MRNHRRPCFIACLATVLTWTNSASPQDKPAAEPAAESSRGEFFIQSVYQSTKRSARWLSSMQREDGLFVYGWQVDANRPLPGDNFLRQAGAAGALARASAFSSDPQLERSARQAIGSLLSKFTKPDPEHPEQRRPTLPTTEANPVGFASLLLLAISELPMNGTSAVDDGEAAAKQALLSHAEAIARFIASRQRADGSINVSASFEADAEDDTESVSFYPGEALYALIRHHAQKPADWKLAVIEKALPYYEKYFREQPSLAFVPWQSAAYAEAYIFRPNPNFARFVFQMNDWLKQFQYVDATSVPVAWVGGFGEFQDKQALRVTPGMSTASYAESFVEAARLAKLVGDTPRRTEYQTSAALAFSFLMNHQYNPKTSKHLAPWYSAMLSGAFQASVENGSVRIDYAQHAMNGMIHYLNYLAEFKAPAVGEGAETPQAN